MYIPITELKLRLNKIFKATQELTDEEVDSILIRANANMIYLTGTVVLGYAYLHKDLDLPIFFLERPTQALDEMPDSCCYSVRKPELIPDILKGKGFSVSERTALEQDELSFSEYGRLSKLSETGRVSPFSANGIMLRARMIKTPFEIEIMRESALVHCKIYEDVPRLYRQGMTELELQIELERAMRLRGSIGTFRCYGPRMEIFMGNIISGDNAQSPAPYDFAMGGVGTPPMPMGAANRIIQPNSSVMVDLAGNYSVYNTDITRTYSLGTLPDKAYHAHEVARGICRFFEHHVKDGTPVADIYLHAQERVAEEQLESVFMGTEFQAKFVGHGMGIQINEQPVLIGKSKEQFRSGMTIAVEPKFVLPGIGPVGMENTYLITDTGVELFSPVEESIVPLDK
ncbi:MAG: M24 family metallopeptidase [Porphyromonas sp.]|nr:M24 family metallopeptidase [Porphyromonas sp.]